jgi:transglutaminase-like putative cysteine protease
MRLKIDATLDYHFPAPADVLLALEVAQLPDQLLVEDQLTVSTGTPLTPVEGQQSIGRRTWAAGEGDFVARYTATVDVDRPLPDIARIQAAPLRELPGLVIPFLWSSRYCRADKAREFALETFGNLQGGAQVLAMADWIRTNIAYTPGSSDGETTSADTFQQKQGICRDFAHVMISFCRALGLPARMVSAYAWRLDPPDFHAVVEVYLDGGWHLVDPTGLAPIEGLARIGVGRDAVDISFMTIFGNAELRNQSVAVERID